MNATVKGGIIFSIGGAIGFLAGWFVHEKHSRSQVEAEISEMRLHYNLKEQELLNRHKEVVEEAAAVVVAEEVKKFEKPSLNELKSRYTSTDDSDVEEFDKDFPPKQKLKLPGQLF